MWDLDTLHYLNQQAHLRSVERAMEDARERRATREASEVYPLSILARRLVIGPPSIAYILDLLQNSETVAFFMELVSEYLPDYEQEIRSAYVDERMTLFVRYFEQHYFPLHDLDMWDEFALEDFCRQIPVELMGFTYEDYENFSDFRIGYVWLMAVIECPYHQEENERVPLLDYMGDLVGRDLVGYIPKEGWSPDELHAKTDGGPFDGAAHFADWVHSQTNCWQLDANYGEYEGEPWYMATVQALTDQWPKVCEIQDKMARVVEFIEQNPKNRFVEFLDIMLDEDLRDFVVPPEQLPLPLDKWGQVKKT